MLFPPTRCQRRLKTSRKDLKFRVCPRNTPEDQKKQPSQDGLGVLVGAVGEMIVFGPNIERLVLDAPAAVPTGMYDAGSKVMVNLSGNAVLGPATNLTVILCDATGMTPHGFAGIQRSADGVVKLTFTGGVSRRYQPFFDLYPRRGINQFGGLAGVGFVAADEQRDQRFDVC